MPNPEEKNTSAEEQNQWALELVTGLPLMPGQKVIALDSVEDRLFVCYDDLTLMEVSLKQRQIVNEINIGDSEEMGELAGQKCTAFAMFKELDMLAVSTP